MSIQFKQLKRMMMTYRIVASGFGIYKFECIRHGYEGGDEQERISEHFVVNI